MGCCGSKKEPAERPPNPHIGDDHYDPTAGEACSSISEGGEKDSRLSKDSRMNREAAAEAEARLKAQLARKDLESGLKGHKEMAPRPGDQGLDLLDLDLGVSQSLVETNGK